MTFSDIKWRNSVPRERGTQGSVRGIETPRDVCGRHWRIDLSGLGGLGGKRTNACKFEAPRDDLFYLWRLEGERVHANAARFDEQKYVEFIDERIRPSVTKEVLIRDMQETLKTEPSVEPIEHFPVRSPKEALVGLPERNVFRFDFGLVSRQIERRTRQLRLPFWIVTDHERKYGT
jgi:hypothetical protein